MALLQRWSVRAGVLLLVLSAARLANAWPTGEQFDGDPVSEGGGGGLSFTGAPRWSAHDCSVCHMDPPREVRLKIDADPVALFASGYQPGREYRLRVALVGEHAAVDALSAGDSCLPAVDRRCDDNGFALELDDGAGRPTGTFLPLGADGRCGGAPPPVDAAARVLAAGDAIVHSGYHHGLDSWAFCWTAPAAGAGPVTIFASAVDGNGGDGTNANPDDVQGDDVVTGAVPVMEAGGRSPSVQSGGCALGRCSPDPIPGSLIVVACALVVARARRRRR